MTEDRKNNDIQISPFTIHKIEGGFGTCQTYQMGYDYNELQEVNITPEEYYENVVNGCNEFCHMCNQNNNDKEKS